jgi:hypothetical protein
MFAIFSLMRNCGEGMGKGKAVGKINQVAHNT